MNRILIFTYGLLSYAIGMAGLVYFILAVSAWELISGHINSKELTSNSTAIITNIILVLLFSVQHSVMARQSFKKVLVKFVPQAAERSTYVLCSGVVTFALAYFWQPIAGELWNIENVIVANILNTIQMLGWGLVVLSSFMINHFELFGLQQVYYHFRQEKLPQPTFTDRFFYKLVRHPLQLGVLIGVWSTSRMTTTHLMLASCLTLYILVGLYFEEKDLVKFLGEEYVAYKKRVRMLIPFPKKA